MAELVLALSGSLKAVGGKWKAGAAWVPSLPLMSLEEPGVGGGLGRGIVEGELDRLSEVEFAAAGL